MKIKKKTHYTMKILIHLALEQVNGNELIEIRQISDDLDIAYEHARKVVQSLAKQNIIETIRGRGGGIKLAKSTDEIHIYDLIMEFEGVHLDDFKHDCKNCNMPDDCNFRHKLKEQYKLFYLSFKGTYLSDYLPKKENSFNE